MSYKIAVASSDGIHIDKTFGAAKEFLIYEVTDEAYVKSEVRAAEEVRNAADEAAQPQKESGLQDGCGNTGGCGKDGCNSQTGGGCSGGGEVSGKVELVSDCRSIVCKKIVQPPKEKNNKINFKNFYESARPEIIEMFKNFDLDPVFLYCNSTVEELSHISESLATTCICGTLGNYLGNALEEKYGVPYVRSINQCGITGFETWLREIGKVTDRSDKIEAYIEEQRAIYLPQIEEVKKELKGLRAVIGMGPGYTFEVSRVLNELGVEVVWALAWHYDKKYENGDVPPSMKYLLDNDINFEASVADQQNYEVMNILNKYQPDLYLSRHPGSTVWAIKNGTPAVYVADEYMIFGYKHTLEFAYTILDSIRNRSFEQNLAKRTKLPYTDWWYQQNVDAFLEEAKK